MIQTINAQVKQGQILMTEKVKLPENTIVYVSYKDKSKDDFFLNATESSLNKIWDNNEDNIYEQLLKK